MTKYIFTVPYTVEEFDYEDMGFKLEEWEKLTPNERQNAAEEHAQLLFDSIDYNLEHH